MPNLVRCAVLVSAAVTLLVLLVINSAPDAGAAAERDRYIVVFEDSVEHPASVARAQAEQRSGKLGFVYRDVLHGYSAELPVQAAEALRRDPRVKYVVVDGEVAPSAQTTPTGIARTFATAHKALDIDGVDDVRVDADIAVIDTGVDYTHPDLNVVARTDCSNGTEKEAKCVDSSGTDTLGHGTHVAGIVGAIDNGSGVVGAAPGARIWAVKVLQTGVNWQSEIIAGIDWVTTKRKDGTPENDIEVANMSLGCVVQELCPTKPMDEAITKTVEAGVVVVVSAGNSTADAKNYTPANSPNAITVSALADYDGQSGGKKGATSCTDDFPGDHTTQFHTDDTNASFSNYGSTVEVVAPGVCILSTYPGNAYKVASGTSMAAPHVAGAAAVLAARDAPQSKAEVEAIRERLLEAGNSGWTDTSPDGIQEPLLDIGAFPVGWKIVSTPNGSGAEHSYLNDVSCEPATTTACTAVGKQTASGGTSSPYAQYWNGSSWTNQSTATPAGATAAELQANHCLSKTSCVAAGSYTTVSGTFSLVEAWNGTSWSIQTTPNPVGSTETRLNGISCQVITACVAVGYKGSGSSSQPVAIGGNSGTWSLQTVPLPAGAVGAELTGVECTSSTSCRAVGRYYPTASATTYWAMVSTWNGTTWSSEAVPKPTGSPKRSTLLDISCAGGSNCTAVGGYMNSSGTQVSYVERWNGTSWSWQASPNPIGSLNTVFQNVSCVENSPCVAVGDWLEEGTLWIPMGQSWNGASWVEDGMESYGSQTFGLYNGAACRNSSCVGVGWVTVGGKDKTIGVVR